MQDDLAQGDLILENPLWQYSLSVYSKAGVEPLLIQLQDEFSADVNLLLCGYWLESQQRVLDAKQWGSLIEVSAEWRTECVMPLRSVRRFLKTQSGLEGFREQVKTAETNAERFQQGMLYRQLLAMDYLQAEQKNSSHFINLKIYAGFLSNVDWQEISGPLTDLQKLLQAC